MPIKLSADIDADDSAVCTNAVVAICVVFVPAIAVGAVGVPVSAGLAFVANNVYAPPDVRAAVEPDVTDVVVVGIVGISVIFAIV